MAGKASKTAAYIGKKAFSKVPVGGGGGKRVGGGAKTPGEKGNRRIEMNCGDPIDPKVGPTADPADRAHGAMVLVARRGSEEDGRTLLVPAAIKERRGRSGVRASRCSPAWHATRNLVARPRRYHDSNMRGTLVDVGVELDEREVPRRLVTRVHGRVGLDSVEDDLVERAMDLRHETGTDLLRGGSVDPGTPLGMAINQNVRLRDLLERRSRRKPSPLEQAADWILATAKQREKRLGSTNEDGTWWIDGIEAERLADEARKQAPAADAMAPTPIERPSERPKNGLSIEGQRKERRR